MEAMSRIQQARTARMMVTDGDRLARMLVLKDLFRFLDGRAEPGRK